MIFHKVYSISYTDEDINKNNNYLCGFQSNNNIDFIHIFNFDKPFDINLIPVAVQQQKVNCSDQKTIKFNKIFQLPVNTDNTDLYVLPYSIRSSNKKARAIYIWINDYDDRQKISESCIHHSLVAQNLIVYKNQFIQCEEYTCRIAYILDSESYCHMLYGEYDPCFTSIYYVDKLYMERQSYGKCCLDIVKCADYIILDQEYLSNDPNIINTVALKLTSEYLIDYKKSRRKKHYNETNITYFYGDQNTGKTFLLKVLEKHNIIKCICDIKNMKEYIYCLKELKSEYNRIGCSNINVILVRKDLFDEDSCKQIVMTERTNNVHVVFHCNSIGNTTRLKNENEIFFAKPSKLVRNILLKLLFNSSELDKKTRRQLVTVTENMSLWNIIKRVERFKNISLVSNSDKDRTDIVDLFKGYI